VKIYTKTGDKGETSLIGGIRISKTDLRLEAYGAVDELNAFVGFLIAGITDKETQQFLSGIQNCLFDLGSELATNRNSATDLPDKKLFEEATQLIEKEIDKLTELLPPLRNFVLPGGNKAAARCHLCRTIARRAERKMWTAEAHYPIAKECFVFINRLSDYFFVLARKFVYIAGNEEFFWESHCRT
jgi:cob(I)alamin adenosyltransferase